jgi:hypothetical protein
MANIDGILHLAPAPSSATLVSIAVTPAYAILNPMTSRQLTATGTYSDGSTRDVTAQAAWDTSDAQDVTVSNAPGSQGLASALQCCLAVISATVGNITGRTTVSISGLVGIDVTAQSPTPTLAVGGALQLNAMGRWQSPTAANVTTGVRWSSANPAVASVSNAAGSAGRVTGGAPGTTTISAWLGGITGSITVTVTP